MSDPSPRRHAASTALGVAADADVAQARAIFLRALVDQQFSPQPLTSAAVHEFGVLPSFAHLAHHLNEREERAWAQAIEEFADRYWERPPPERDAEWARLLSATTAWPRLQLRLGQLQAGLSIVLPTSPDAEVQDFIDAITRLYPRPPLEQSPLWFEFLGDDNNKKRLRRTAATLQRAHPALFALIAARIQADICPPRPGYWRRMLTRPKPLVKLGDVALRQSANDKSTNQASVAGSRMIYLLLCLGGVLLTMLSRNWNTETQPIYVPAPSKNLYESIDSKRMEELAKVLQASRESSDSAVRMRVRLGRLMDEPGVTEEERQFARRIREKLLHREDLTIGETLFLKAAERAQFQWTPELREMVKQTPKGSDKR